MMDKEIFLKDLGSRIRHLRIQHGWTQEQLAAKCGYTSKSKNTTIQKIEAGKSDIPASKVQIISIVLETTPSALLGWKETSKKK